MHGIRHTKVPTGCMPCTHSHATVTVVLDGPKLSYSNSRRRPVQRYVPRLYKRDNGLKAHTYLGAGLETLLTCPMRPAHVSGLRAERFGSLLRFSGYMMMRAAMALGPAT